MIRAFSSALVLSIGLVAASLHAAPPLTPLSIREDVKRAGAKAVVDRLYASHAYENVVIKRIGEGSPAWIMLAPALSEGTDAATSEELGEALIYALPKSPAAVLSVIDVDGSSGPRKPSIVCSASFYEGDPTDPRRYRAAAIRAVERVDDGKLAAAKRACLAYLTKS